MPYSASALAGVALIAHRFGASWASASPTGGRPKYGPSRSLALVSYSSVRLPSAAHLPAIAAATVLRPTPPLPTTRINLRSRFTAWLSHSPRRPRSRRPQHPQVRNRRRLQHLQ